MAASFSFTMGSYFFMAITSISTLTSLGRRATSTQERAGSTSPVKYVAYTSLMSPKSSIFLMNTVVLNTSSMVQPAAASTAFTFSRDCLVWACGRCYRDLTGGVHQIARYNTLGIGADGAGRLIRCNFCCHGNYPLSVDILPRACQGKDRFSLLYTIPVCLSTVFCAMCCLLFTNTPATSS